MSDFSHLNPHQNLRCLSLSGGGVRGIVSIKLLAVLDRKLKTDASQAFDMFCGTSIGAILALGLAVGRSANELNEIFFKQADKIFGHPRRLNPFGVRGSKHDSVGLRSVVEEVLGNERQTNLSKLDKRILLISVSGSTNQVAYFGNVGDVNGQECHDATLVDAALASSAAPFFLPAHPIGREMFLDGGLVSNNPDLEAYQVGTKKFSRTEESLKILSLGTGRVTPTSMTSQMTNPRSFQWLGRLSLIDRLMQMQSLKPSLAVAASLGRNYQRLDVDLKTAVRLDDASQATLEMLSNSAAAKAKETLATNGGHIASFFR
ncbi:patatin-like phospholipase family protein [Tateyamaria omphalii]|uniref:CBASS cGAMP-activated phospholipase n=1 Tax=Tateyamaria omphalii TaxID=299262 RepID=UPI001C99D982|nr:CBASS cGAMP-activated phospholipase [Tateyamaria omphalii]MBY5933113.1 patatin-like phospholipase family protein [Tateyamaria omphalii]